MPNVTTHYSLYKPLVADAIDEDLWGGYLNDNFDSLDTIIYNGLRLLASSKTSTYTLVETDNGKIILADMSGGAFNLTLPSAASFENGFHVHVKKVDSSANNLQLSGVVDGITNPKLTKQNDVVELISNGTSWYFAQQAAPVAQQLAKAWGYFDASSGTIANSSYYNCSVSRTGVGVYVVTLTNAMATANYPVMGSIWRGSGAEPSGWFRNDSTTQFTIFTSSAGTTTGNGDGRISFVVYGE